MNKRGKEIKLDLSPNYKISCGTVNNKNAKAIFINITAWGEPTIDEELNYNRIISSLGKCIKQSIYNEVVDNHSSSFNVNRTIVDMDMRESGIKYGKSSFMNCEITLFQEDDVKPVTDEDLLKTISILISKGIECIDDFEYFKFNKTK